MRADLSSCYTERINHLAAKEEVDLFVREVADLTAENAAKTVDVNLHAVITRYKGNNINKDTNTTTAILEDIMSDAIKKWKNKWEVCCFFYSGFDNEFFICGFGKFIIINTFSFQNSNNNLELVMDLDVTNICAHSAITTYKADILRLVGRLMTLAEQLRITELHRRDMAMIDSFLISIKKPQDCIVDLKGAINRHLLLRIQMDSVSYLFVYTHPTRPTAYWIIPFKKISD